MQLSKEIFVKLQQSVAFFKGFSNGELLALLKLAQTESFGPDEIVFKEGTRGDKMYIILTGVVRISRPMGKGEEQILVKLQPGACFGEMGIIDRSPRSARATADGGPAVLLSIKENLLSQGNVLLAYKLFRNFSIMLAERLRDTNNQLQEAAGSSQQSAKQIKEMLKKHTDSGGTMQGMNLKNLNLSESFMNNSNLENALLVGAHLEGTKMKQANFSKANFVNAQFKSVRFEGGDFSGANFTAANLEGAEFNGCNFKGANFTAAEMTAAQIESAQKPPEPPSSDE